MTFSNLYLPFYVKKIFFKKHLTWNAFHKLYYRKTYAFSLLLVLGNELQVVSRYSKAS